MNEDKDKFFSIISHDLKSPFNGLIGLTRIIEEDGPDLDKEDILNLNHQIHKSALRAYALVESLLEWSLIQMGRLEVKLELVSLSALVAEVCQMNQEKSKQKNIQLCNNLSHDLNVKVDYQMARSILHNLVSNALKFTSTGGTVEVSANVQEPWALVHVKDSGVGMGPEILNSLFRIDVHHSTRGTEEEGGTGLGLSLCKEMVGLHGGQITATSEEGVGSTFTFSIPLA